MIEKTFFFKGIYDAFLSKWLIITLVKDIYIFIPQINIIFHYKVKDNYKGWKRTNGGNF